MTHRIQPLLLLVLLVIPFHSVIAAETGNYPVAIFNFSEKSRSLAGMGEKVSALVFAKLVANPELELVDREELNKMLDESALSLSGMVNPQQATQVGQLTGARILVTGTVFEIDGNLMLVAKIIGTETSRVLGASVKGQSSDDLTVLAEKLSAEIAKVIDSGAKNLVANPVSTEDRLLALKKQLKDVDKPTVAIDIQERHVSRAAIDPAAETEMTRYCIESGFDVINKGEENTATADILITGEGFTEYASRRGDIIGIKARLEIKAIDQVSHKIIAVDRQTELQLDLSEMVAAKKALQQAAEKIAERLLPKLVEQ